MASNHSIVFQTGRVYEWDAAQAVLGESGIHSYGEAHSFGGVVEAMPSTPTPAPGVSFALLVHNEEADRARTLLADAGFSTDNEPEFWHFNSDPWAQSWWRRISIVFLLGFLLFAGLELLPLLSR